MASLIPMLLIGLNPDFPHVVKKKPGQGLSGLVLQRFHTSFLTARNFDGMFPDLLKPIEEIRYQP